ncbi:FluG family protein [Penicillium argentinense]|uniref:FluG family protein n=1 Tax=Penicillium argentinense TaxID=1131581 RepID=A0A9W9FLV9_9EURO|nr:FluG family protein [Penicillium argentinense]KAJ5102567.1 FluG family protein [Penicillium argentinense]
MTPEGLQFLDLIESVARALSSVDIAIEQFQAEASPGQWESVPPLADPVKAVGVLLHTHEKVMLVAQSLGYRATNSTQHFPQQPANGAHVHLSVNARHSAKTIQTSDHLKEQLLEKSNAESFFDGVIKHFPSIWHSRFPATSATTA